MLKTTLHQLIEQFARTWPEEVSPKLEFCKRGVDGKTHRNARQTFVRYAIVGKIELSQAVGELESGTDCCCAVVGDAVRSKKKRFHVTVNRYDHARECLCSFHADFVASKIETAKR
mmetsp:Transcript_9215/g.29343  ORF Transcript_9215/g.29343 Transcript_9215/m.29343 type:complete len:116 (+) Transcript_9215:2570-2917(+)